MKSFPRLGENLPCRPTGAFRADDASLLQFVDEQNGLAVDDAELPLKMGDRCTACRAHRFNGPFIVGGDKRFATTPCAHVQSFATRHVIPSMSDSHCAPCPHVGTLGAEKKSGVPYILMFY